MNLNRVISVLFFSVLVLWADRFEVGCSQDSNGNTNYITWEDLIVRDNWLNSRRDVDGDLVLVVDKSGRGDSITVQGAVDLVPEFNSERVKIHILPGIYREKVIIPVSKPYISFIGKQNEASETTITWQDKASDGDGHGNFIGTWNSSSVSIESDYFCASWITFENTVVSTGIDGFQAVALRISGDRAMFYKVRILGSQDTLLDDIGNHFFYQCYIQGTIDFIFGNAKSLYRECCIQVVGNGFAVAAQHRSSPYEDTGFSFLNCTITGTGYVFLGRAWGNYSKIVYSYCKFDANIRPDGWENWNDTSRESTVMFGEYQCRGVAADRTGRVSWSKGLDYLGAKPFLDARFIRGKDWLKL